MRLPRAAHTGRPWRIHEFTRDFRVLDVWSCRAPGAGPDDFHVMLAAIRGSAAGQPAVVRFLFAVRTALGALLGLDKPATGLGGRVKPVRDRLPAGLRATAPDVLGSVFTPLYLLRDEYAAEMANSTVHGILHLGWVPAGDDGHELRMAVLVRPNGRAGRLYLAFIAPFRYLVVYPALLRRWERAWRCHSPQASPVGGEERGA